MIEATGVYHERVTHFLFDIGEKVSVVLPNKARHFAQTLKTKTVTDKESCKMLATFGIEKQTDVWHKPNPIYSQLKQLTREREQLTSELTVNRNLLHAEEHSADVFPSTMERIERRIDILKEQIIEIEQEINSIIKSDNVLHKKVKNICTIKGLAIITAITIISETNGFNLIRSSKQLVSYAGYDVMEKSSGISVRNKSRISKKAINIFVEYYIFQLL